MFEIGWGKLVLIGIVALLVIGPKELPTVLRTLGQWVTKLRRMASEFQSQFHEAMREAEVDDLKKQVDEMTSQAQSYANFDPAGEVRREFETTQQQIESALADKPPADAASPPAVEEARSGAAPAVAEPAPALGSDAPSVAPPLSAAIETETVGALAEPVKQDAGDKPA